MNVIIVNCFDTYEHRVILLKEFFNAHGFNVDVITSDFRHIHKVSRNENLNNFILLPVKSYSKNISISRFNSHYLFSRDSFKIINNMRPELLWILAPPNSLVKRSAQYKKKNPEVKLVIDIIDMWPEALPFPMFLKMIPPFSWWKNSRDNYLDIADQVVTECNLYKSKLSSLKKQKGLQTLYLAKDMTYHKDTARNLISTSLLIDNRLSLCYLGSINNIIDIKTISRLVKKLRKLSYKVDFHIIGDGEKKEKFIQDLENAGANVQYHGRIFDEVEKQRIFDFCHFGINIMKHSVFVGMSMKTLDYFAAGLPIINNLQGDTWSIVEEHNLGFNLSRNLSLSQVVSFNILEARERTLSFFKNELSKQSFNNKLSSILELVLDNIHN